MLFAIKSFVFLKVSSASEPPKRKPNKSKGGDDESGFSSDGSPNQSRRRTPMTMPRTKVTPATPLEQRIALKRLKQRLNFEDQENKVSIHISSINANSLHIHCLQTNYYNLNTTMQENLHVVVCDL